MYFLDGCRLRVPLLDTKCESSPDSPRNVGARVSPPQREFGPAFRGRVWTRPPPLRQALTCAGG
jgi:hypothetical protein